MKPKEEEDEDEDDEDDRDWEQVKSSHSTVWRSLKYVIYHPLKP